MSALSKLGIVLAAVPIAIGGSYLMHSAFVDEMPSIVPINNSQEYQFIDDSLKKYFVDPDKDENKKWWSWSHRNRWEKDNLRATPLTKEFKSLKTGEKEGEALKNACKEIYKKEKSLITPNKEELDTKVLESELWRYCSYIGIKPMEKADTKNTQN